MQHLAIGTPKLDILAGVTPVVMQPIVERGLKGCGKRADGRQRFSDDATTANRQQILASCVDILDTLRIVDQQNGRGQQIEASKGSVTDIHGEIVACSPRLDEHTCPTDRAFILIAGNLPDPSHAPPLNAYIADLLLRATQWV